ncbi:hypothetical protein [Candidatus Nucleicultrix amoebiphila]|uniref:Uncharacterized protein n=1 Tax=Candidatus Nucleicultrix amoebiphila FS5 TaxID=1414854 RepID=A0A1W6N2I9_9PROT|nr:hypothetical protein [Candidatus Nucleicultrix amoebiphila]ARN84057.1 hypothetical protein GQ61_00360 [Candidatus Nucleicultrix amoebiphila FS5]
MKYLKFYKILAIGGLLFNSDRLLAEVFYDVNQQMETTPGLSQGYEDLLKDMDQLIGKFPVNQNQKERVVVSLMEKARQLLTKYQLDLEKTAKAKAQKEQAENLKNS